MRASRSREGGLNQPHRFFRPYGTGPSMTLRDPRSTPWAAFFRRSRLLLPLFVAIYSLSPIRHGLRHWRDFHRSAASGNASAPFIYGNEFCGNPHLARALAKVDFGAAPFPVMGLWTARTRLKTRVLTNAYFSLTQKLEGVQQDRSLTAS